MLEKPKTMNENEFFEKETKKKKMIENNQNA